MKKEKQFILASVILGGLFFLFGLEVIPDSFQFQELLDSNDVIIIFNSGGWGDTSLAEAQDFAPIVAEIQKTLDGWGYNSVVISYNRTKDTLSGELAGTKDFLNSFNDSSENLAKDLESLAENLPDKKIIMTGLSNGGAFVERTMEKISGETKKSVYAITVGIPFWQPTAKSDNILQLNNNGGDALATGKAGSLMFSLLKTPLGWIASKIKGQNIPFPLAFRAPGHEYIWSSPEVGPQIVSFLEDKLR